MKKSREEILFEQLMKKAAEEEGKRLLEENERLKADPSAAVPEEVNQRMIDCLRNSTNSPKHVCFRLKIFQSY